MGGKASTAAPAEGPTKMEEDKEYTMQEVALHNSAEDCWLVISGVVYDCTYFLDDHPGGPEWLTKVSGILTVALRICTFAHLKSNHLITWRCIIQYAGKDATEGFEQVMCPQVDVLS